MIINPAYSTNPAPASRPAPRIRETTVVRHPLSLRLVFVTMTAALPPDTTTNPSTVRESAPTPGGSRGPTSCR
ncbi:hypothetical protein SAVCW2_48480 [Streptomyces avermitilis]|uniref:Uncharacterized protein n=1 Tax=Streptomyces avermitilis TaxID=33903 RepID=A0A4D4MZ49_STRAX|nr:hypothetical protein SAV31267_062000 [Streptomyces avermitilis]GDY85649.1 hypothetical protein SAVCW2_48480 [Streptomyces avermitilis]